VACLLLASRSNNYFLVAIVAMDELHGREEDESNVTHIAFLYDLIYNYIFVDFLTPKFID
jgi:hypothetical protein